MHARLRLLLLVPFVWPRLALANEAVPDEGRWGSADARRAAAMRAGGVSASAGGAPSDAALLATVMRRLAAVRDSRAEFTEEKTIAALRAPLHSSGRLAYRRPDRLEKITEWPQVEVLAVHGGTLSLTDNGATRTIVLASEPAIGALVEAILGTLAGDLAGLRRWYHVGATGTPAAWRLSLRPRTPALAKFIRAAVVDGAGARMTRLRMVEANGDTSVMTISPA